VLSSNCLSRVEDENTSKVQKKLSENTSKVNKLKQDQLSKYALSVISDVKSYPKPNLAISSSERIGCSLEVLKLSSQSSALYNSQREHIVTFGKYKNRYGHYLTSLDKVMFVSFKDKESSNVFGTLNVEGHRYKLARSYSNFIIAYSEKDFDQSQFSKHKNGFKFSKLKLETVDNNEDYLSSLDGFIVSSIHSIVKGLAEYREQVVLRDISKFDSLGLRHTKGLLRCQRAYSNSQDSLVYSSITDALKELKNHIYIPNQSKK
jgi:hypothetical protein